MRIFNFFLEVILINQCLDSLQLITTGIQAADGQKCPLLRMSDSFRKSSPCFKTCRKANQKCKICQKKNGRSREICMLVHKKTFVTKCKSCIKNPHGLTRDEIKRITYLNNFKLGLKSVKFFRASVHVFMGDFEP